MQHCFALSRKSLRFLWSAMGIAIANRKNRCDFGALRRSSLTCLARFGTQNQKKTFDCLRSTTPPCAWKPDLGAEKSTQTFFVQSFSTTLRVMDVRAENRGRPHQKVRFPAAPVVGRNFLTPGHPGVRVRNVRAKSGPKSLCFCCFFFPDDFRLIPAWNVQSWFDKSILASKLLISNVFPLLKLDGFYIASRDLFIKPLGPRQ